MSKYPNYTPWRWFKPFSYFLMTWPLLCLLALDEMMNSNEGWITILLFFFVPFGIGVLLYGTWSGLNRIGYDWWLKRPILPQSLLSDLNTTLSIFMSLVALTVFLMWFVDDQTNPMLMQRGGMLVGGVAFLRLLCEGVSRWVYGPPYTKKLGTNWSKQIGPTINLLAYLSFMVFFLFTAVMVSYYCEGKTYFSALEHALVFGALFVGVRSCKVLSIGEWARTPWEGECRHRSILIPWLGMGSIARYCFWWFVDRCALVGSLLGRRKLVGCSIRHGSTRPLLHRYITYGCKGYLRQNDKRTHIL